MNIHGRVFSAGCAGAALAIALTGCSSGSGSAGSEAAAALTTGQTTTGQTPASSPTATGSSASAGGAGSSASGASSAAGTVAQAQLATPQGVEVGTVSFAVDGDVVTVTAEVEGLPAGFKGFHIHAIGKCEPNSPNPADPSKVGDFLSAGGHLGASAAAHPGHQGDLSSLEVRSDGSAELVTTTDAFDLDAVLDADGSAVMVHAGPDNFGNIPTRYAPAPDADTQATGDSGGRAACGVVTATG